MGTLVFQAAHLFILITHIIKDLIPRHKLHKRSERPPLPGEGGGNSPEILGQGRTDRGFVVFVDHPVGNAFGP